MIFRIPSNALPSALAITRTVATLCRDHSLWNPGQRIGVGVSGGKDSLALTALLLAAHQLGLPSPSITLLHVPPPAACPCAQEATALPGVLARMFPRVPFHSLLPSKITIAGNDDDSPGALTPEKPSCAVCSRVRRKTLFESCSRLGIETLALAHHEDDLAQTFLLNILFHGKAEGVIEPLRRFGGGSLRLVRPLLTTPEKAIRSFSHKMGFMRNPGPASARIDSQRSTIRAFLDGLGRRKNHVRRNLARMARESWQDVEFARKAHQGGGALDFVFQSGFDNGECKRKG